MTKQVAIADGLYVRLSPSVCQELVEMRSKSKGRERNRKPGVVFARQFRDAWKRIPLAARRVLLKYWRTWPGRLRIELTNFRLLPGQIAQCADYGFTLLFIPWLDLLVKEIERTVVHELAHAFRHAVGDSQLSETTETSEIETIKLAENWGFKQKPFRRSAYRQEIERDKLIAELTARRKEVAD